MARVLIVYAHPEPRSFNGALLSLAKRTFESLGDELRISDLYAMGFDPVVRASDFRSRERKERLDYFERKSKAKETED